MGIYILKRKTFLAFRYAVSNHAQESVNKSLTRFWFDYVLIRCWVYNMIHKASRQLYSRSILSARFNNTLRYPAFPRDYDVPILIENKG